MPTYKDFEMLILKSAWQYANDINELDELVGVGHEVFMKILERHDPSRGEFSTLLHTACRNAMINFLRTFRRENGHTSIDHLEEMYEDRDCPCAYGLPINHSDNPEERYIFLDKLYGMSEEAREVIKLIFESPSAIIEQSGSLAPRLLRGAVVEILRENNWAWPKIWKTFREIKGVLYA